MPLLRRSPLLGALLAAIAVLAWVPAARAGSKNAVAALGQPAPGGGIFAGPSFTGWPAAAGTGWIAFRTKISGGSTNEAIVAAHMTAPVTRTKVAALGDDAPKTAGGTETGTFREFLGRPAINANGDVAFVALLTPAEKVVDPNAPDAAGVFLFRQTPPPDEPALISIALSGTSVGSGLLDLASPVDPSVEAGAVDIQERAPALNDAGTIAFLSAVRSGAQAAGAIFVRSAADGTLRAVVRIGDPFDDETLASLGPPALNRTGGLAFRALLDGPTTGAAKEGIFSYDGTTVTMLMRDQMAVHGNELDPKDQLLTSFGNLLTLNDAGDIAFTAGPLTGPDSSGGGSAACGGAASSVIDDDSLGVLVFHAGMVRVLAHPGKRLGVDRVSSVVLGPSTGGEVPIPALAEDGSVVFFASLDGGSSEALVRAPADTTQGYAILRQLGGPFASDAPVGGKFVSTLSTPALDASGGIALLARVAGGSIGEPLVYLPPTGNASAVVTGDPLPSASDDNGYFAGPPFGTPVMNDRGDVAFRAQVARGTSSVGIFWRAAGGPLQALVRTGDPAPLPGAPMFTDLVGDISLNGSGTVAFTGVVDGFGRGVYTVGPDGLGAVAVKGFTAESEAKTFITVGLNPSINRDGAVAFHATVEYPDPNPPEGSDPENPPVLRQEGLYLADSSGIRLVTAVCAPSSSDPTALPFLKLRDPELTGAPSAAFRAQIGPDLLTLTNGLFLADPAGVTRVALVGDDLGGGFTVADFSGVPSVDSDGDVAFLATRAQGPRLSPALLRYTPAGIDLLAWRGMPGPLGGILKGFGQPSMNNHRHVAFRGAFQAGTGGKAGFLLSTDGGLSSLVQVGENTPFEGQFTSFGSHGSLNDDDQLAFVATLTRGQYRNGVFTVSPAGLTVQALSLRLSGVGRDTVRLGAALAPGVGSNGLFPDAERVTVALADAGGTFWQASIPKGKLKRRGALFVPSPRKTLHKQVAAFGITTTAVGPATVTLRSAPSDFTGLGQRSLVPPFTVTVEIGDDSATTSVNCTVRGRHVRCL